MEQALRSERVCAGRVPVARALQAVDELLGVEGTHGGEELRFAICGGGERFDNPPKRARLPELERGLERRRALLGGERERELPLPSSKQIA